MYHLNHLPTKYQPYQIQPHWHSNKDSNTNTHEITKAMYHLNHRSQSDINYIKSNHLQLTATVHIIIRDSMQNVRCIYYNQIIKRLHMILQTVWIWWNRATLITLVSLSFSVRPQNLGSGGVNSLPLNEIHTSSNIVWICECVRNASSDIVNIMIQSWKHW